MTSKLTKILALLLVCVMVVGMFAGCGKKEAPADDTTTTGTPDDTTATDDTTTGEDTAANDTLVVAYDCGQCPAPPQL